MKKVPPTPQQVDDAKQKQVERETQRAADEAAKAQIEAARAFADRMSTASGRLGASLEDLAGKLKGGFSAALDALPFKGLQAELGSLVGGLAPVVKGAGGLVTGFAKLADTLMNAGSTFASHLTQAALAPIAPMTKLGDTIAGFVAAYSPATVQRYQLAVRDLTAVLGEALTPVMAKVTESVRRFADMLLNSDVPGQIGDILGGIVEASQPLVDAMFKLLQALMPVAEIIAEILKPAFEAVASVVKVLVEIFQAVGDALYEVGRRIANAIPFGEHIERRDFGEERRIREGLAREGGQRSSVGLGIRDVQVSTGAGALEAVRQRIATNAFKIAAPTHEAEMQRTAKDQLDALHELVRINGGMTPAMKRIADELRTKAGMDHYSDDAMNWGDDRDPGIKLESDGPYKKKWVPLEPLDIGANPLPESYSGGEGGDIGGGMTPDSYNGVGDFDIGSLTEESRKLREQQNHQGVN